MWGQCPDHYFISFDPNEQRSRFYTAWYYMLAKRTNKQTDRQAYRHADRNIPSIANEEGVINGW